MVSALEHEKSFLTQESSSDIRSMVTYEDSLLLTVSTDIVQRDINTGAIQRTFRGHKKKIASFVSTNDSRMITSAFDDMIIVWDLNTGSILKRIWLRSSDTLIRSIWFQDEQVFAGGSDEKVRQVDLVTGRVVRTIPFIGVVLCVVASSNSLFVGKTLSPNVLKLDIESGDIILNLNGHPTSVFSLFLLDSLLFSGSADTTIICWNSVNGEIIRKYIGHAGSVYTVAVFDGELYSTASGKELFKWSINDGQITKKFPAVHENTILSLAFKSQTLFTGSVDTTIIKWDSVSGDILFSYTGRNSVIRSVVSWQNFIISGGDDREIRMWDTSTNSIDPLAVFDNSRSNINCLYMFEDNIYSGDNNGDVKMFSVTKLILIRTYTTQRDSIVFLVAGKFSLYAGGFYGYIHKWNMSSGIQTALVYAHEAEVNSLQLIGDIIYSGSKDGTAKVWNTESLNNVGIFTNFNRISSILIKEDFLIVCTARTVESRSLVTGENSVLLEEPFACLCMISRENTAFTGHEDSFVRVRSLDSLITYETYAGHLDSVLALCFDEVLNLYSSGFDGTIKKWNTAFRRVAFSFENRNGSVSSLAVYQKQLFFGLKNGRIDCYNTENAKSLTSLKFHSKTVSSLISFNDSVYSSGLDGAVLKFFSTGDRNFTTVYKSDQEPLRGLVVQGLFLIAVQGDTKIVLIPMKSNSESVKVFDFQMPLVCVAATESVILAGSKSGIIYAWDIETFQLAFELKGHVSPVNNMLVADERLFSASDDKTIIEWSLESRTTSKTLKRLSAFALGHLGPVNSLSFCSDTLFSAGSDLTVRRWNTNNGKHDDVYFGFTKSVTSVVCYNGSVFAGSEDFSVLLFKPSLPQNPVGTGKPTTISKKTTNQRRIVRPQKGQSVTVNVSLVIVTVSIVFVVVIIIVCGYLLMKKRSKKVLSPPESSATVMGTVSVQTIMDLATVINSVMGISKHAAYLIDNAALATVKQIAAGGGGELYLAKVMDPGFRKKIPEIVVQKIVFIKNKISEEAFYQEVGIMILLSPFPNFCQIIGYTENPLSMILKHYSDGSLHGWLVKSKYGSIIIVKILKETASALNVMHSHYLAHCDLKPQNVLVEEENGIPTCFITDFGITQVLSESIIAAKSFNIINLRGLSVHYASPEAFTSFRTKKYSSINFKMFDVFSFGCLAYEVQTTKTPWL
ncbi:hypothetical protein MP638_005179 [Amoeboaphelidium occidentale]|nr:hypothetical protein MP638_005179 [Amoeboaphelidium occidentale]